jgi:DNA (cytosine-5)-methyltransferase 1
MRSVTRRDGLKVESLVAEGLCLADGPVDSDIAEQVVLRSRTVPPHTTEKGELAVLDLFAGCGGLSLGLHEAARSLNLALQTTAVDLDPAAERVYVNNFPSARFMRADVRELFNGDLGERPTSSERGLRQLVGQPLLLTGGPPCQGHSAFNNRTRHDDSRNSLLLKMVRAAEVLRPRHVFIENVPGARRDREGVVQRAEQDLRRLGYSVSTTVLDAALFGVAQRRKRLLLIASLDNEFDFQELVAHHSIPSPRSVEWAIADLVDLPRASAFDSPALSAPATCARIKYLFEHDLFELPNSERPPCHANGDHSYRSIYGRLRWGEPAQTITTGFYSMCMGRYVHPAKPRTITAHEAARLQFFPDHFDFGPIAKRGDLARLIGNAVPAKVAYVVGLELLR